MPIINLKEIRWSGIYSFSETEQVFQFHPGFYLLLGNNGSGKSSFLNLVSLALFDNSPSAKKKEAINETLGRGRVNLDFSVDGTDYSVNYFRAGKTFAWELKRGAEMVVTGAETGQYIETLLGFGYEQFVNAFYLTQNSHFSLKLFFGDPGDRLNILSRVFGLDRYLDASEKAREKAAQFEGRLAELRTAHVSGKSQIETLQRIMAESDFAGMERTLESKRTELEIATREYESKSSFYKRTYDELGVEMEQLNTDSDSNSLGQMELERQLFGKKTQANTLNEQARKYKEYIEFNNDYKVLVSEIELLKAQAKVKWTMVHNLVVESGTKKGQLREAQERVDNILGGSGRCDRCGSEVTAEQLTQYRMELERKIQEIQGSLPQLENDIETATNEFTTIDKSRMDALEGENRFRVKYADCQDGKITSVVVDQAEFIEVDIQTLMAQIEKSKEMTSILQRKKEELAERIRQTAGMRQEVERISKLKTTLETEINNLKSNLDNRERLTTNIRTVEENQNAIELQLQAVTQQADAIRFWVGGFKELAILRLSKYVDGINAKMAELLSDFGMTCWIDVLEAKKSAKDLMSLDSYKRKANLFVSADGKKNVPIEAFSGGERQLLSLALVLAVGTVVGNLNYLALDEVFGSLDVTNRGKIVNLLEREKTRGLLTGVCVLMVSHDEEIRASGIWDGTVKFTKDAGFSTVQREAG